jgi:YhcH/YjgK/YiaL family protein
MQVGRALLANDPRFSAAFRYVEELLQPGSEANRRIKAVLPGATQKVELPGGAFALEQAYESKPRTESFFESHRRMIDVQVIVEGAELMEVEDVSRLPVDVPYDSNKDLIKYGDSATASHLILQVGDAAIFFPADGHMPTLQAGGRSVLVRKSVVKIPVGTA